MLLNSCCCCISLKTGCIVIGILNIINAVGVVSNPSWQSIVNGIVLTLASVSLIYGAAKVRHICYVDFGVFGSICVCNYFWIFLFLSNLKKQYLFLLPILVVYVLEIIVYSIIIIIALFSSDWMREVLTHWGYIDDEIDSILIVGLVFLLLLIGMRNWVYPNYRFWIIYAATFPIFSFQDLLHARDI